jgi:hypothetical protein
VAISYDRSIEHWGQIKILGISLPDERLSAAGSHCHSSVESLCFQAR